MSVLLEAAPPVGDCHCADSGLGLILTFTADVEEVKNKISDSIKAKIRNYNASLKLWTVFNITLIY